MCPNLQNTVLETVEQQGYLCLFSREGSPEHPFSPQPLALLYAHCISPHYAPIILFFPYQFTNLSNLPFEQHPPNVLSKHCPVVPRLGPHMVP